MPVIQLDLNNPEFQANLLALDKPDAWAVLKTLRLLQTMSWEQLQGSKGLRWELIQSRRGTNVTWALPWLAMITSSPARAAFTIRESWLLASSMFTCTTIASALGQLSQKWLSACRWESQAARQAKRLGRGLRRYPSQISASWRDKPGKSGVASSTWSRSSR